MCEVFYEIFEVELEVELCRSKYIPIEMQHFDWDIFCVQQGWAL